MSILNKFVYYTANSKVCLKKTWSEIVVTPLVKFLINMSIYEEGVCPANSGLVFD